MNPEMTTKQEWLELHGCDGTEYVPMDVLNGEQFDNLSRLDMLCEQSLSDIYASLYSRVLVWSARVTRGYGVRLSASGYLDCTDWTVYTTKREALKAVREMAKEGDD